MRSTRFMHIARGVAGGLLAVGLLAAIGCEQQSPTSRPSSPSLPAGPAASAPASAPAAPPPMLSEAERSTMPMYVSTQVDRAYRLASEDPGNPANIFNLASLYYVHGFPAHAALALEQFAAARAGDVGWLRAAGLAHDKANQIPQAISAFERALAAKPNDDVVCIRLADLVLPSDPARAGELYRRALDLNPVSPQATYGLARVAMAQKRPDEAMKQLNRAIGLVPGYAEAHRAMAELLTAAGRTAEAAKHTQQAEAGQAKLPLDDSVEALMLHCGLDPQTWCAEAEGLAQQRKFDQAEDYVNTARRSGATEIQYQLSLGVLRAYQGRTQDSIDCFRRACELDPASDAARFNLAQVLVSTSQPAEAESLYREILKHRPDDDATLKCFADLMSKAGKPDEPIRVVEQALAADPDNPTLHFWLGQFLIGAKREDEGLEHLRKALALRPDFLMARRSLAIGLAVKGDRTAARAEWQAILQVHPKYLDGYMAVATLAEADNDSTAVERAFRAGLAQLPDTPVLMNALAWLLATSPEASQRKGAEAVALAEKLCTATKYSDHTCLDTLAAAYAEAGRFEDAVRAEKQAIERAGQVKADQALGNYRSRLALYEKKEPFRTTTQPAPPTGSQPSPTSQQK